MRALRNRTILVVDDDKRLCTLVAEMVKALGYRALKAMGSQEALQIFEAVGSNVDALITDMQMPGINGEELIGRLRSNRPALPAIVMTGYAASVPLGYDVLEKPFGLANLDNLLTNVLGKASRDEVIRSHV